MDLNLVKCLLIVCPVVFIAGIIDSIAGGGGILTIPAYLIAGLPVHYAYGTNKMVSCCGTFAATFNYWKNNLVQFKIAIPALIAAFIGSSLGARAALLLDEKVLKIFILCILPFITLFVVMNKKFDDQNAVMKEKVLVPSLLIGFTIGMYDGFFGPGTGSFLTICFTSVIGCKLLNASANAKVVNLTSNVAALITYLLAGKVIFVIAVPALFCSIAGNIVGSKLAIKNGGKIIKPVLIISVIMVFIKMAMDLAEYL